MMLLGISISTRPTLRTRRPSFLFTTRSLLVEEKWLTFTQFRQRRFKSIVEKAGFKLENGKQVIGGMPINQDEDMKGSSISSTLTPKKPRKKAEPGSKRRKNNNGKAAKTDPEAEDEGGADCEDGKREGDEDREAAAGSA